MMPYKSNLSSPTLDTFAGNPVRNSTPLGVHGHPGQELVLPLSQPLPEAKFLPAAASGAYDRNELAFASNWVKCSFAILLFLGEDGSKLIENMCSTHE
eukprot:1352584-Amorphochlora_amoeboformis.AAC.1